MADPADPAAAGRIPGGWTVFVGFNATVVGGYVTGYGTGIS